MPTARKEQQVEELQALVSRATITISTGYRGLSVAEMIVLRRRMRDAGVDVRVVKNTLLKIAAERAGQPKVAELGSGPTAILFGYGDVATPAKAVQEYVRTARTALTVNSAFMDGQLLSAGQLGDIANLPSREQLLANLIGGLRSPVAAFASLLQGTIQQFAGLVEARANQLEGSAA